MNKLKKIVGSLILIFTIFQLSTGKSSAQNRLIRNQGFYYAFEGSYGLKEKLKSNSVVTTDAFFPKSYGLKATANWFLNYHLSAGAGLGVLNFEDPNMFTMPVLLNVQGYLSEASNSALAYAEGGYGLRLNHKNFNSKGLIYELGIGYRYRIKWANFMMFKIGYRSFQNNQWQYKQIGTTNTFHWIDLKAQTINFSIGFYYSTRY